MDFTEVLKVLVLIVSILQCLKGAQNETPKNVEKPQQEELQQVSE